MVNLKGGQSCPIPMEKRKRKVMKLRTAIVDNDPELLGQLKSILEEEREIALLGAFGHPGRLLDFIKEQPVDLVFSDVVMPEISGITLA